MTAVETQVGVALRLEALSEGMAEGTLLRWLVADGAVVAAGEPVAEVETDKATTELEAPAAGPLWRCVAEGEAVPVGVALAVVGGPRDAAVAHAGGVPAAAPAAAPAQAAPAAAQVGAHAPLHGRVVASPLARRIARERGIDLAAVRGSGPRGRIVRGDVELASAPAAPAAPAPAAPTPGGRGRTERIAASRVQLRIAQRMALAKSTIPDFAVSMSVEMDAAVALRRSLTEAAARAGGRGPSLNDMVVKACGLALREHPRANGSYADGELHLHERVNVGVAVTADDSLVVPTVFDADRRSLTSIAAETRRLAGAVREGRVTADELSGGTFTVSNLGMFGVSDFVAVVNPPQAAILAVGGVEQVPVVRDGALTIGTRMTVTLSCDHRILYGADAAAFLVRVRELLEAPFALLS